MRSPIAVLTVIAGLAARSRRARLRTRRPRPATAAPRRPSTASPRRPPSTRCAAAATRPTPRSRRPPCSASPSRSPAASAAAASWSPTTPRKRRVTTLDHRERAPLAMNPESFFENGAPLAFNDARYSGLSVGVPGTVLRLGARAAPARDDHARAGARAGDPRRARRASSSTTRSSRRSQENLDVLRRRARRRRRCTSIADGTPRDVGTVFRNPDLARTYRLIARRGRARLLPRARSRPRSRRPCAQPQVSPAADHVWRPGVMTAADLRAYTAPERAPVALDVPRPRRLRDGPAVERRPDDRRGAEHPRGLRPRARCRAPTPCTACSRRRGWRSPTAARTSPTADFFVVPRIGLLSKDFAATRRALIGDRAGTSPAAPGDPYPFDGGGAAGAGEASVTSTRAGTTTHITVADRRGDVVSYTFTIESTGGAGLVVPGYGFLLNNELTDFNFTSRTHPNRVAGRQAPAQLDGADDRAARRAAVARARLARRVDDHHDGARAARRPHRPRPAAAGRRSRRRARASATRRRRPPSRRSSSRPRRRRSRRAGTRSR